MGSSFVTSEQTLAIRIAKSLQARGFAIATSEGWPISSASTDSAFGLLVQHPPAVGRFARIRNFYNSFKRRVFLGVLWFEKNSLNTATDKSWFLDLYGESNTESARLVADELAKEFGVHLTVRLSHQATRLEACPTCDDGCGM